MTLAMTAAQRDDIVAHAREGFPNEVCGILAGVGRSVRRVLRARNTEPSPVSYYMDPGEQFRFQRLMRDEGLEMVGIYHSHPQGPPVPSQTDVELAFYDESVYVIVGFTGGRPDVRGFRIVDGDVSRVELRITDEHDETQ